MRTIEWRGDHVVLVDQTRLPHETVWLEVRDVDTMIDAIERHRDRVNRDVILQGVKWVPDALAAREAAGKAAVR